MRIQHIVPLKIGAVIGHPFSLRESRRAPGPACQGSAIGLGFALGAVTLKPSDFCTIGIDVMKFSVSSTASGKLNLHLGMR
jgi:hypothetical protein